MFSVLMLVVQSNTNIHVISAGEEELEAFEGGYYVARS